LSRLILLHKVVLRHKSIIFHEEFAGFLVLCDLQQRLSIGEGCVDGHIYADEFHLVVEADDAPLLERLNILFTDVARFVVEQPV